jgi:signal transduction histidine kinase/DNA-binding response OmpR family regulator
MQSASSPDSVRRFDLAVQTSHLAVFTVGLVVALVGRSLGVFELSMRAAVALWLASCLCSLLFTALLKRGADRRFVTALWILCDVAWPTIGVAISGGIGSPWFIWYLATASGAAFAISKRVLGAVVVLSTVAYLGMLTALGQIHFGDAGFVLALTRMLFLFGASFFFLVGVANLQEKRLRIRQLESEESRKIAELTRLAEELREKTEELAEANCRIQEADRLKSQFLANMSHELRTPMNSIIGFSEILVERLDGKVEPKHLNFLRHILASGQHLLSIINDILDLSKIEAGKMEIYPERFDVHQVIESVCHVMRGLARAKPNLVIDVPDDLPPIETDLAKFKQILFNLVSNAVKFSPPEQPITVSARHIGQTRGEGTITVSVRDEGIGIDPKDQDVIFEEFRQVDGTVKREFGGTGLGLALVKKFAELQGGWVRVESTPGHGSTFTFALPLRARAAVVSRVPGPPSVEADEKGADRVLVVEDDAHAYDLISSALTSAGYLSIRARHGEEAIRLARESNPIAVTLDLVLPGLDGWEVLKRLKADSFTREIPVVIISMVENRELGVALGADDYFVKPVDRERLLERIRHLTNDRMPRARLLLIDDDSAVHALLEEELAALGYTIESAFSGEMGVRVARESAPDLIILDLMMPGMSGFEVAGALKEDAATANIPILVLTSKEISAEDRRELQSKVTTFVQKGTTSREQLVREIRRLERRRVSA